MVWRSEDAIDTIRLDVEAGPELHVGVVAVETRPDNGVSATSAVPAD